MNNNIDVTEIRKLNREKLIKDFTKAKLDIARGDTDKVFIEVENSHDYPFLLRFWAEKLPKNMNRDEIVNFILGHENLHAIPGLAKEYLGITIRFGIILESRNNEVISTPSILYNNPKEIDILSKEGAEIAFTILELLLNPILHGYFMSDYDADEIRRYLSLFEADKTFYEEIISYLRKNLNEAEFERIINPDSKRTDVTLHSTNIIHT